ncbi:hypothetical protein BEWA_022010 [Theileria equi strain WA]|uniref:FHA domain-containing protein n=1 Tax=Theileria equi strain WA TaxID=1537102 RepID=L0AVU0_THEEQ|nr:hypothetical protein BEWA_022010 [Theileria equi strain WA]AFZ79353.1 hypothetical protein BEWA_022010 [Theileria equi strain WA]|eukprot:XP_004829019.1 hypothetical protein BEWA_022010 [Theileria equi strain WA]
MDDEAPVKDDSWRELSLSLPLSIKKKGTDPKGTLLYTPPSWGASVSHLSDIDVYVEVISNGVVLGNVKLSDKGYYILGSQDDCDFVYKNPQVSRKHFVLQFNRFSNLLIYDLNSKCGTTVNHMRLEPEKYYTLNIGDQIRIGKRGFSSRVYIISGKSIFSREEDSESDDSKEEKPTEKRGAAYRDIEQIQKFRKRQIDLEEKTVVRDKPDVGSYDTRLDVDEWDDYFDAAIKKPEKKTTVLNKSNVLDNIRKLQQQELDLLNRWYISVKDALTPAEFGEGIDSELQDVKRRELDKDKTKFQKQLDGIRDDLEYYHKLLRVASF